jgi:hypothetical protein
MNLKTIAGQAAAVILIVNTIQQTTGFGARWFGLTLAILMSVAAFFQSARDEGRGFSWGDVLGAVLGGFIVYSTAFGVNALTISEQQTERAQVYTTYEVDVPAPGGASVREARARIENRNVNVEPAERSFTTPW